MDKFVTIASFYEPSRAAFFRSVLEAEGIDTFLANENFTSLGIHTSLLSGGMKLQVPEADVEKATRILENPPDFNEEDGLEPDEEKDIYEEAEPEYMPEKMKEVKCVNCGSTDIVSRGSSFLSSLIFSTDSESNPKNWTCRNCQWQWKE